MPDTRLPALDEPLVRATLFDLTAEQVDLLRTLQAYENHLEAREGEVTDEESAQYDALLDLVDRSFDSIEKKLDGYGFVMAEMDAVIEAEKAKMEVIQRRLDELRRRAARADRIKNRLKARALAALQELDLQKVTCDHHVFRRQVNSNFTYDVDEEALPDELTRRVPDKAAIMAVAKKFFKQPDQAPSWLTIHPRGEHLRVQ